MILGLIADSHGRVENTRRAVRELSSAGIDLLLHLGDIGSEAVIDELVGHPARIVFGNCDDDRSLAAYAGHVDVAVAHPLGWIETDDRRVAFTHGHLVPLMSEALRSGADYLLHGHTHELRDEHLGPTRVINPGALFRAERYTAARLDLRTDRLEILEIDRD